MTARTTDLLRPYRVTMIRPPNKEFVEFVIQWQEFFD